MTGHKSTSANTGDGAESSFNIKVSNGACEFRNFPVSIGEGACIRCYVCIRCYAFIPSVLVEKV